MNTYCEDCEYLELDITGINKEYHCNAPDNIVEEIKITWLRRIESIDRKLHPSRKNINNNCKSYKDRKALSEQLRMARKR